MDTESTTCKKCNRAMWVKDVTDSGVCSECAQLVESEFADMPTDARTGRKAK